MISIELKNIGASLKDLQQLQKKLENELEQFVDELGDIGVEVARNGYSSASYDGDKDISVTKTKWDGKRLIVKASGKSVLFVEFGTGVSQVPYHEKANDFGFVRGGYGKGLGKRNAWVYKGQAGTNGVDLGKGKILTRGNPASRSMLIASEEIKKSVLTVAKKVFSK